ncbi:hypothetical protein MasN3_16120 [Massilia varians]|uniref:Integrase n=1 Tax=Massilia varians TaxID=457921 RepID=A0ABM8C4I4_9BURK|nr:hypothetical protein [Massilia varians]BDT58118.1 hypothetical protein MasN3_16120 [Massilia varians]
MPKLADIRPVSELEHLICAGFKLFPKSIIPDASQQGAALLLLRDTGWKKLADFNIDELANMIKTQNSDTKKDAPTNKALYYRLLRAFEFADAQILTRQLRHQFMMWCESGQFKTTQFSNFRKNLANFSNMRVNGMIRERVETPEQIRDRNARAKVNEFKKRQAAGPNAYVQALLDAANSFDSEACSEYFIKLGQANSSSHRPTDWIFKPTPYPGLEKFDIKKYGHVWLKCIRSYLRYRAIRKEVESERETRHILTLLCDYLFAYLPFWLDRNNGGNIEYPASPKQLLRFVFVSRSRFDDSEELPTAEKLPRPFLELISLRRTSPEAFNRVVVSLKKFFDYIQSSYDDDVNIAGPGFVNPIKLELDKKPTGRPSNKTNKIPFPEDVWPYLIYYANAAEAFGEYLQERAYTADVYAGIHPLSSLNEKKHYGYNTAEWGYIPFITYRGKVWPVLWIPELYYVEQRVLHANPPGHAGLYVNGRRINVGPDRHLILRIPHLTVLRMLLVMIETGLRGNSVQWLDRKTWEYEGKDTPISELHTWSPAARLTYLYVNTDKARNEGWQTYITWRVQRTLRAEQYFQESISEPEMDQTVQYESRTHTRFAPILPLFRSTRRPTPPSDSTYSAYWTELLKGFDYFYNTRRDKDQVVVAEPIRSVNCGAITDSDGVVRVELQLDRDAPHGGWQFCPLKWEPIHTPHACRATYATHRDGDLEVSEVAMQLGHQNTVTTNHYQVPPDTRIRAKLEMIDRRMMEGESAYDVEGTGAGYIKPNSPQSSVRQAFGQDRAQAIKDFGFVPGVALWSTEEVSAADTDALDLLRQSPSSVIRWHATHVCPVGDQCPSDIVARTGGIQRCGLCPLAAKHVDHLPAIAAKKNELKERIRMAARRMQAISESGASQEAIDVLHRSIQLDTKEFLGWELSTEILNDKFRSLGDGQGSYHVDQPEIVKRHLELVVRNTTESQFFLQRISDSNAYPMLESSEVRARAAKYTRLIMAAAGKAEDAALLDIEPFDELAAFASVVKPMAEAKGIKLTDLAQALDSIATKTIRLHKAAKPKLLPASSE